METYEWLSMVPELASVTLLMYLVFRQQDKALEKVMEGLHSQREMDFERWKILVELCKMRNCDD